MQVLKKPLKTDPQSHWLQVEKNYIKIPVDTTNRS